MNHSGIRRLAGALVFLLLLLAGCAEPAETPLQSVTYLDIFDTVTTILGSGEDFPDEARKAHETLLQLHRLFDIYNDYEGVSNLKTVNDHAGLAPVPVEPPVIRLLLDCRAYSEATGGAVNAAMGSVLSLWHDAREEGLADPENARLPDAAVLREAALHTDFDDVIIDEEAGTVYLADPAMRLDVGAIAKGWAADYAAARMKEGMLLSIGGNVLVTGPKDTAGSPWIVGVQAPDGPADAYVAAASLTEGALVTSGDYQRFYTVGGVRYPHIIDPATNFPANRWRSVTVYAPESGLADALSTALFVLDRESGDRLLERFGAEALRIAPDGTCIPTAGFPLR